MIPGSPPVGTDGLGDRWRTLAWLLLLVGFLAASITGLRWRSATESFDITIQLSTTTSGNGQIFPRTNEGYRARDALDFDLISDGRLHTYSARFSTSGLRFRVDPGANSGRVRVGSILIRSHGRSLLLKGDAVTDRIRPLNQLIPSQSRVPNDFISQGGDPYFEVTIPRQFAGDYRAKRHMGLFLAIFGALGCAWLLTRARKRLLDAAKRYRAHVLVAPLIAAASAFALLAGLRVGCSGFCSANGFGYGAALTGAALLSAVVGAALVQCLGLGNVWRRPRLFLWIIVGQLAMVGIVYLSSAAHTMVPTVPFGPAVLALPIIAAAAYLAASLPSPARANLPRRTTWLLMEVALLAVICVVIADRELPRFVMLSSDPDIHAFLTHQLDVLGGIPWFGEQVFHYPAGTAAFGFVWSHLAFLDARNALTSLPLLQSYLAALVLAETVALRIRPTAARMVIVLVVLGITAAGFLIPLYAQYSHMEGTGRQMAIATEALIPVLLLGDRRRALRLDRSLAALVALALFGLAVLNPISVVMPAILIAGYLVYFAVAHHRVSWCAAGLLCLPGLALLDPYYFSLFTGSALPTPKTTISAALHAQSLTDLMSSWLGNLRSPYGRKVMESASFGFGQKAPLFGLFLLILAVMGKLAGQRVKIGAPGVLATATAGAGLLLCISLLDSLQGDPRFYLLGPYFWFSVGQFKILLVTALAAALLMVGTIRQWRLPTLALTGLAAIAVVRLGIGMTQHLVFEPRVGNCGSLGCPSADDVAVLEDFAKLKRQGRFLDSIESGRVLVPNSVHDSRNEDWVFPVSGARTLPFYDVLAPAFYYYQGDDDYTTENYKSHVCRHFDRQWLVAHEIRYLFLPSNRGSACVDGLDQLPLTETVMIRHGSSYLLRLD